MIIHKVAVSLGEVMTTTDEPELAIATYHNEGIKAIHIGYDAAAAQAVYDAACAALRMLRNPSLSVEYTQEAPDACVTRLFHFQREHQLLEREGWTETYAASHVWERSSE